MPPINYLHIDCDLYAGSKDALTLLGEHLASGAILAFDEVKSCRCHLNQHTHH